MKINNNQQNINQKPNVQSWLTEDDVYAGMEIYIYIPDYNTDDYYHIFNGNYVA